MNIERSISAFVRARNAIAGGVNSPVRAFKAVGGSPIFMQSGKGATLIDLDDHEYIDYVLSWGPLLLGHAHPAVVKAITNAAARGSTFGAPTEAESELAELIRAMMPSIERVRFTSSGTETTMSALRLARGFTRREKLIKFAGCYHGHADSFLISAGSGALTNGVPTSPGITSGTARDTIVVPYNDADAVAAAFDANPDSIAAVFVEPYAGNMGLVLPHPGFLQTLRDLCSQNGALLIFDEVMTGFRVARGGVQARENVTPDLTTLGKVIGGGLPVGAFGGREEIMATLSPDGPVYQAGTLSGNPLAMAAGIATLKIVRDDATLFERLEVLTKLLCDGLHEVFVKHGIPHYSTHAGSMFCTFFTPGPVDDLDGAMKSDAAFYAKYFHAMLDRGVYFAPAQFEAGFVSTAHSTREIEQTIAAADAALVDLAINPLGVAVAQA
ncbi:MAG TPA: glutamate-1-semialdehyde 2,1-aminomutase [Verrucomicrobiae bacterium]|jgi:glutamate-1-semialdehyde 2,1-aminomutase|nr:glutamate-1-semialdehyde 2,1-aminomutase [Verrucomicrobiae bacterium]